MNLHQLTQQRKLVSTYPNRGLTFTSGEGSYLITEDGERYLDLMSNYGVNQLGYNNPELNERIKEQVDRLMFLHSSFNNDKRAAATNKLVRQINKCGLKNLKRIYWSNSGAEAIEAAIKFAILATGKTRFIAAKNAYHGKTFGALSGTTSGEGKYQKPFKNVLLTFDTVEYGNINELEEIINEDHAALILEPIQGEGGVIVPPSDYLPKVSELCKEKGILLIIDEIQTGVGRTGYFVNIEQYNLTPPTPLNRGEEGSNLDSPPTRGARGVLPDILCLAKGLGSGLPVGATLVTEEINSKIPKGIQTSTLGGNPLSLAGVEATIDYFNSHPELLEEVREKGEYFRQELEKIKTEYPDLISDISGQGLMIGIGVKVDPIEIIKKLQELNVIAAPTSKDRIRFLPTLTINEEEIDVALEVLGKVLKN